MRNFRGGGGVEKFSGGGGVAKFSGRGLSREGLNFFGRGDIFSGGVWQFFGGRVEIFWVRLGIFRRPG